MPHLLVSLCRRHSSLLRCLLCCWRNWVDRATVPRRHLRIHDVSPLGSIAARSDRIPIAKHNLQNPPWAAQPKLGGEEVSHQALVIPKQADDCSMDTSCDRKEFSSDPNDHLASFAISRMVLFFFSPSWNEPQTERQCRTVMS